MLDVLKEKYKRGVVNKETLLMYVNSGYISPLDYKNITGEKYVEDHAPSGILFGLYVIVFALVLGVFGIVKFF